MQKEEHIDSDIDLKQLQMHMQPKYKKIIDNDGLEGMAAFLNMKQGPKRRVLQRFYKSGFTLSDRGVLINNDYL